MIVISDTSPIINLAVIGQLEILRNLFKLVIIPQEVYDEIVIKGKNEPGSEEIKNANWISVRECNNKKVIQDLNQFLDKGESSAIALAIELNADYLLIDESLGREYAKKYNLPVMGLIGILFKAKNEGLIPKVLPLVNSLISEAKFWIKNVFLSLAKF